MERRLAAILAADMAGYSRMMAASEQSTIRRQKDHFSALIAPRVAQFHGRIVKTMGDGFLVEFSSAVDAVECAMDIQRQMPEREADVPEEQRIRYRMGINLGDIVLDDGDVLGDGVNVASRLESLAKPGGICISDAVHQALQGKLSQPFSDLGDQTLKNLTRKVRVWHWTADDAASTASQAASSVGLPARDRPSIAVLPFANMSGDPEQEYFADGIAEDIIAGLSKNSDVLVISRNSTFSYKGRSVPSKEIARDLDARYILEGSVRKAGQRVRITAQLIDTQKDSHLWAERFDRELVDIFAVQDEVVSSIVNALGASDGALEKSARQERAHTTGASQSAYDCYLKAREYFYQPKDSGFAKAEELFERAIELDPAFARAYSALAWLHFVRFKHIQSATFESLAQKVLDLALRSVQLDPNDYRGHWVLGALYVHQAKHSQSTAEYERAIRLNPNDANLLVFSADALIYCGRVHEALERCERAIRLNPNCPDWYWWLLGHCHFHLGDYDKALEALSRMVSLDAPRRLLAATYAHLGRLDEAKQEATRYMQAFPDFSIRKWAETEPYLNAQELDRYVEGMRMAGLPE